MNNHPFSTKMEPPHSMMPFIKINKGINIGITQIIPKQELINIEIQKNHKTEHSNFYTYEEFIKKMNINLERIF